MQYSKPFRRSARIWCLSLLGAAAASCEFGTVAHQLDLTGSDLVAALSVAGEPGTAYIVSTQAWGTGPSHVRGYDTNTGASIGTTASWSGSWDFIAVEKVEDNFGGGPSKVITLHQNGHIVTWPTTLGSWTTWDSGYFFDKTREGDFVGTPGVDADFVCDFESKDGQHWFLAGVTVDQATGELHPYVEHIGYYIDDVVNIDFDLIESPYPASTLSGGFQNYCPKIAMDPVTDEFRVLWRDTASSSGSFHNTYAHRYRLDPVYDGFDIVEVAVSPDTAGHTYFARQDQMATSGEHYIYLRRFTMELFHETTGREDSEVFSALYVDMSDWWVGSDATRRMWVADGASLYAVSFVP